MLATLLRDLPRLAFIGDLDPVDLTVFCFLRDRLKHGEMVYAGVSAGWLECVRPKRGGEIRMGASEIENWTVLQQACPDVREVIGEPSCALLDSGSKIELEGAAQRAFVGERLDAIPKYMRDFGIELVPR